MSPLDSLNIPFMPGLEVEKMCWYDYCQVVVADLILSIKYIIMLLSLLSIMNDDDDGWSWYQRADR